MNKVASGKNIRSTLSLLNVSAECEVIRARNSVNRHSVEIQNAEDLPFSRGKRPHVEQQTTSIDGQTATSFISQFKFNTAVPNTTTGIKEPHHLELRNTKFATLSSPGENIIGSDTGSSFKVPKRNQSQWSLAKVLRNHLEFYSQRQWKLAMNHV